MKKFITLLLIFTFVTPPANAIMGGEKADSDPKVVAIIPSNESQRQGCSGALIAPRIVLTAGHCINRMPNGPLSEKNPLWVALPGTRIYLNGTKTAKVVAQYRPDYYEDSFYDKTGPNSHGPLYDFAVLVLEEPLSSQTFRISTMEETVDLINRGAELLSLGYGYSNYGGYVDPSPMKTKTYARSQFLWQGAEEKGILQTKPYYKLGMIVQTNLPDNVYHGGGDSGSPIWTNINGEWVYVGALSGAMGPSANLSKDDPMWNNKFWMENAGGQYYSAWAFQYLIDEANKFLDNIEKNKKEVEHKNPIIIEQQKINIVIEKSETPLLVIAKKTAIVCIKGKTIKKITALKPKCPTGYKKI